MNRLLATALALIPLAALADPRGDRRGPRVILYEHPNFRGGAIVLTPGEAVENLARWDFDNGRRANDRISSIRVEGGAEAVLYVDSRFRGESLRVTHDIRDLAALRGRLNFDDQTSSVRTEFGDPPDYRPPGPRPGPGRPVPAPPRVDVDVIITRSYRDILEREVDDSGRKHFRSLIIDQGWTEKQVRDHLRASEEYRNRVVPAMLSRVYRDLLGREPDRNGFDHYRNKVLEHAWTEAAVRDDIKRSVEYRQRQQLTGNPRPGY